MSVKEQRRTLEQMSMEQPHQSCESFFNGGGGGGGLTVTGKAIRPQLVALVTATEEGAVRVVTPLRAGRPHVTFIHI